MGSVNGKADTPAQILEAAQAVFAEKGYENATTRAISERAGIAKGLVYYHFKNKEEMLFRICVTAADDLIESMRQAIEENARQTGTPKDKLKNLLLRYAKSYLSAKNFNKILLHDIEYLQPEKKEIILQKEKQNVHQLRDYLQTLVAAGELRPLEPTVMTFTLISSLHWLYFWYRPDRSLSLETVIDQIAEIFLSGTSASS